jgi:hypothetical protein
LNIFILDENPVKAAEYHCNKHVVKMILESAQMLSTVHWQYLWDDLKKNNHRREFKRQRDKLAYIKENTESHVQPPYKMTHIHHPCTIWTSMSYGNYMWHVELAQALLQEYTKRYNKIHKSTPVVKWLADHPPKGIPIKPRTHFAVAIKDPSLKVLDPKTSVGLGPDRQEAPLTWELVRDIGVKAGCITDQNMNVIDFDQKNNFRQLKKLTDEKKLYYTYYDVVASYRRYYIKDKVRFAKWEPHTKTPDWFLEGLNER